MDIVAEDQAADSAKANPDYDGFLVHHYRPPENYTIIPNASLRDARISFAALGVLAEILSRPPNWRASADRMTRAPGDGRRTVRALFRELEAAGYLHRVITGGRGGAKTDLHIFDVPQPCGIRGCKTCPVVRQVLSREYPADQVERPIVAGPTDVPETEAEGGTSKERIKDQVQEPKTTPRSRPSRIFDRPGDRPEVDALCDYLADQINIFLLSRPVITRQWRTSCRLMIDKDRRSPEQIRAAVDFAMDDEFWRTNILSMPTLRKRYLQLQAKAKRDRWRPAGSTRYSAGNALSDNDVAIDLDGGEAIDLDGGESLAEFN